MRNTVMGYAILLAVTTAAIVWHNIPNTMKQGDTGYQVSSLESRVYLYPEQKFLISGPFDINRATAEELEAIPRIGPSLAKKILEFRHSHGEIVSLEELLEVKGIGTGILKVISPYLTIVNDGGLGTKNAEKQL